MLMGKHHRTVDPLFDCDLRDYGRLGGRERLGSLDRSFGSGELSNNPRSTFSRTRKLRGLGGLRNIPSGIRGFGAREFGQSDIGDRQFRRGLTFPFGLRG